MSCPVPLGSKTLACSESLALFQDEPEKPQRESWMMELPPELQHVGLEARTFKKRSGPENKDRSIWTDTPADRERKARVSIFHRSLFYTRVQVLFWSHNK